ncbi:hypothetical protein [Leifsonia sp. RAF41]|uniref:hypothetical protein n=1 Tax=Leifsonia sp. RAF41 TaxID=3233056 RepID=UPI003F973F59
MSILPLSSAGSRLVGQRRWHDDSDSRLLLHLIEAGEQRIREERAQQIDERRAELERMSARYAGMFTESLASIREGWPE